MRKTLIALMFILVSSATSAITAFPGAEGFGAYTKGGRGGEVIKVTNLIDDGPGSFRAAIETQGPRIIVFEVSGIINLESDLWITEPYITIAGQSSPGGILVTGRAVIVNANDVIMQHLRFRVGSHNMANPETHDAFVIWGGHPQGGGNPAYNIIIDHCSFSWGVDEVFSTAYNPQNITVQWSIISEGLSYAGHPKGEHSKGLMLWNRWSPDTKASLHHNYFAHNTDRNPLIGSLDSSITGTAIADVVNNVAYNYYGCLPMMSFDDARVNWVHNFARGGPDSNPDCYGITIYDWMSPTPSIYVEGNLGPRRTSQSDPEQWYVGSEWRTILVDEGFRQLSRWDAPTVVTTQMSDAYASEVVQNAGATKPFRDSVDERVVNDFAAGTGTIIDDINYPDDYPVFSNPNPPADSDDDGMADAWETDEGLNVGIDDSAQDKDSDGYTNIEEYLFYLTLGDCVHAADNSPCDGCVSAIELTNYLNSWKTGSVTINNLMDAIILWKDGCQE